MLQAYVPEEGDGINIELKDINNENDNEDNENELVQSNEEVEFIAPDDNNNNIINVGKAITIFWICVNIGAVVGLIFINKVIFNGYPNSDIVVTLSHMWTTCLALTGANLSGLFKLKHFPYFQVFLLAALDSSSIVFSNMALQNSPVLIYQIFKVLITPGVAMVQYKMFPNSITGKVSFICIGVVTVGGIVAAISPVNVPLSVFVIGVNVTATILSTLFQTMMAKRMKDFNASPNELLLVQTPMNCLLLVAFLVVFELKSLSYIFRKPEFLGVMLASSLLAPLVNISQAKVIHITSPLTYSIVSQVKTVIITLGSIIFLLDRPTAQAFIGVIIIAIGVGFYFSKFNTSRRTLPNDSLPLSTEKVDNRKRICKPTKFHLFVLASLLFPLCLLSLPPITLSKFPDTYMRYFDAFKDPYRNTPRVVHYVWANEGQVTNISLTTYISVAATYNYLKPDILYWHHSANNSFAGEWWPRLKALVTLNTIEIPKAIGGKSPGFIQHTADVLRLELIDKYGGIYFDTDIIALKPFDDLIAVGKPVLGYQLAKKRSLKSEICNAVIVSPPNATFIHMWYDGYQDYDPSCWTCNSQDKSSHIAYYYPSLVKVLPDDLIFEPSWLNCSLLLDVDTNVSDNYAIHLWNSVCLVGRNITVEGLRASHSTLGIAAAPFISEEYLAEIDNCAAKNITCPMANTTRKYF